MNLPVQVVEAVAERRCVLFSGRRSTLELDPGQVLGERELVRSLVGRRCSLSEALNTTETQVGRDGLEEALRSHLAPDGLRPGHFHRVAIQSFPIIFTTAWDDTFEQAAEEAGQPFVVSYRGEPLPNPETGVVKIHKIWGGFDRPGSVVATANHRRATPLPGDQQRYWRKLLRGHVALFAGYRPDEAEFEVLFDELVAGYGGELPRTHWAVSQGRITDVQWQKWVWRGMLLFTGDPSEVAETLPRTHENP